MPKQRITKEMIVDAAFEIAKTEGMEQVLIKNIAKKIGCSVQPVYTYCANMEGLRKEVEKKACEVIRGFIEKHIVKEDLFRSTGQAYVRLAKENPHLFRLFLLHKRDGISSLDELYQSETNPAVAAFIADTFSIPFGQAKQLHLNLLIYTIGIGTIFASSEICAEEIFSQQEYAFKAFLKASMDQREENGHET